MAEFFVSFAVTLFRFYVRLAQASVKSPASADYPISSTLTKISEILIEERRVWGWKLRPSDVYQLSYLCWRVVNSMLEVKESASSPLLQVLRSTVSHLCSNWWPFIASKIFWYTKCRKIANYSKRRIWPIDQCMLQNSPPLNQSAVFWRDGNYC